MKFTTFNNKRYKESFITELDKLTEIRIDTLINLMTPCERLLDIGCWDGYIMEQILKRKKAQHVFGVDNSRPAVTLARKKGLQVKLVKSADERLPFKDETFNCVVAAELIEHLYDVNTFVKEVGRILKPDGQFLVTTPNLAALGARLSLLLGLTPWLIETELIGSSGHIRYYTFSTLDKLITKYNFKLQDSAVDVLSLTDRFYLRWNAYLPPFLKSFGRIIIASYTKK